MFYTKYFLFKFKDCRRSFLQAYPKELYPKQILGKQIKAVALIFSLSVAIIHKQNQLKSEAGEGIEPSQ